MLSFHVGEVIVVYKKSKVLTAKEMCISNTYKTNCITGNFKSALTFYSLHSKYKKNIF